MENAMLNRRTGASRIRVIHGTASFAGGLFKPHFPTRGEVLAVLRALLKTIDGAAQADDVIELEGAYLYGWGHEQLVLGQALADLAPNEQRRFAYVTKVGRILVTSKPGLTSGQPPGIWPPNATKGPRTESWGFGQNDTDMTLAASSLLVGQTFAACYLHDPPDCMAEMKLDFAAWWAKVNGADGEQGGGVIQAMREARANGIALELGVGCKEVGILQLLLDADRELFDRFSVTQYSLMFQSEFLDFVGNNSTKRRTRPPIKLIAAGPYAGGILSRDPRGQPAEQVFCNYRVASAREIEIGCALWDLAAHHGMSTPMPAAIQFAAQQPWLWGMVLGPRGPEDVTTNAAYLVQEVPVQFWRDLRTLRIGGELVIDERVMLPV